MRKCRGLVRRNGRQIDRQLSDLQSVEKKTKALIKQNAKRGDLKSAKLFAKELYNTRRQENRMIKSKAQLESIRMQMEESFAVAKIQGSMKSSTGVMKEVNRLVKIPELMGTMRELEKELMKVG